MIENRKDTGGFCAGYEAKLFYVLTGFYTVLFAPTLLADVEPIAVHADINQTIIIDLSNSISNVATPDVVIIVAPNDGTATDDPCTGGALT